MKTHRIQLHLEEDGTFVLHYKDAVQNFGSLLEALKFARSLSPDSDARMTVYDASGRPIIETVV